MCSNQKRWCQKVINFWQNAPSVKQRHIIFLILLLTSSDKLNHLLSEPASWLLRIIQRLPCQRIRLELLSRQKKTNMLIQLLLNTFSPQKVRKPLRQLGRGHFAHEALWKFCLRALYTFGKKVWTVWLSSEEEREESSAYGHYVYRYVEGRYTLLLYCGLFLSRAGLRLMIHVMNIV